MRLLFSPTWHKACLQRLCALQSQLLDRFLDEFVMMT